MNSSPVSSGNPVNGGLAGGGQAGSGLVSGGSVGAGLAGSGSVNNGPGPAKTSSSGGPASAQGKMNVVPGPGNLPSGSGRNVQSSSTASGSSGSAADFSYPGEDPVSDLGSDPKVSVPPTQSVPMSASQSVPMPASQSEQVSASQSVPMPVSQSGTGMVKPVAPVQSGQGVPKPVAPVQPGPAVTKSGRPADKAGVDLPKSDSTSGIVSGLVFGQSSVSSAGTSTVADTSSTGTSAGSKAGGSDASLEELAKKLSGWKKDNMIKQSDSGAQKPTPSVQPAVTAVGQNKLSDNKVVGPNDVGVSDVKGEKSVHSPLAIPDSLPGSQKNKGNVQPQVKSGANKKGLKFCRPKKKKKSRKSNFRDKSKGKVTTQVPSVSVSGVQGPAAQPATNTQPAAKPQLVANPLSTVKTQLANKPQSANKPQPTTKPPVHLSSGPQSQGPVVQQSSIPGKTSPMPGQTSPMPGQTSPMPGQTSPMPGQTSPMPASQTTPAVGTMAPISAVNKTSAAGKFPYTIDQLLQIVVDKDASDLHITVGYPVMIRVDGDLVPLSQDLITDKVAIDLILPVLAENKRELLEVNREVDLSYAFKDVARFRINAYYERGHPAAALRLIPGRIRSIEELKLPGIYHQFAKLSQGFVLVTGPTGHGKSTTLAAILQEINVTYPKHIITIEDPIEYLYPPGRALLDQREMHEDTHSWEIALRSALRQDPDVILVGEMRDFETIASAITLAETGHLVFATLHTNNASQTIDRIIDVFPEHQQAQVRTQLSNIIEVVISQRLIPLIGGGRRAVSEVMLVTPAIRNLIREGKTHQIDNVIRTSMDVGMKSLEQSLVDLVREGVITIDDAEGLAVHPEEVVRLLK